MRVVVQRVTRAAVRHTGDPSIPERTIGPGLVLLVGFRAADDAATLRWMAAKCLALRIFAEPEGALDRSVADHGGAVLVIPNFTLYGDARKGRRPSFSDAAPPDQARALFAQFVTALGTGTVPVESGWFQAPMHVELVNDGPVTLLLEHEAHAR